MSFHIWFNSFNWLLFEYHTFPLLILPPSLSLYSPNFPHLINSYKLDYHMNFILFHFQSSLSLSLSLYSPNSPNWLNFSHSYHIVLHPHSHQCLDFTQAFVSFTIVLKLLHWWKDGNVNVCCLLYHSCHTLQCIVYNAIL